MFTLREFFQMEFSRVTALDLVSLGEPREETRPPLATETRLLSEDAAVSQSESNARSVVPRAQDVYEDERSELL